MLRWSPGLSGAAGLAALLCATSASASGSERQAHRFARPAGSPAYVWLWYADGKAIPADSGYCLDLAPPPVYQCNFASGLDGCQRQVQTYLDAWYKDFNLVFTLDRPPKDDYYIVAITSGWPQCAAEAADLTGDIAGNEGGIAPWNYCNDNPKQAAVAIECGRNAHDCATLIAHEHAHMVGLLHTKSATDLVTDVMNPTIRSTAAGFDNQDNAVIVDTPVIGDTCENTKTQNSYQRMLATLGPWPGGDKPSPFPATLDGGAADAATADAADAHHSSSSVGPNSGPFVDAGPIIVLPGFDALTRTPLGAPDAPIIPPAKSHGGCAMAARPPDAARAWAAPLLLCLFYLLSAGIIRSRARRAQPATERLPCAGPARSPSAVRALDCL
jgi:hypothetical protein